MNEYNVFISGINPENEIPKIVEESGHKVVEELRPQLVSMNEDPEGSKKPDLVIIDMSAEGLGISDLQIACQNRIPILTLFNEKEMERRACELEKHGLSTDLIAESIRALSDKIVIYADKQDLREGIQSSIEDLTADKEGSIQRVRERRF